MMAAVDVELSPLVERCRFQSEAFRDLCAAPLVPLLKDVESLTDELACILKQARRRLPLGLLHRALTLLSDMLLLHGDLKGLPYIFTTRLRQQQLHLVTCTLRQALRQWQLSCDPSDSITQLRLQLCLALTDALSLGDTSTEEDLATSLLGRLVALQHGCRYPTRTSARALQLLQEALATTQAAGAGGSSGGRSSIGGSSSSEEQGGSGQGAEAEAAQRLQRQLPGLSSTLCKMLRHGHCIEAFHLQLLADFVGGPSGRGAGGAREAESGGDSPTGPQTKRPRQASLLTAAQAAADPSYPGDGLPGYWQDRVSAAKQVLDCIHFKEMLGPLASPDPLQRYAALLVISEIFRGHIGPAEAINRDAVWQITMVAAGAAAAAGLQPLLLSIAQGRASDPCPGVGGPPASGGTGGAAGADSVAAAAKAWSQQWQAGDSTDAAVKEETLRALALDALAHLALVAPAAGILAAQQGAVASEALAATTTEDFSIQSSPGPAALALVASVPAPSAASRQVEGTVPAAAGGAAEWPPGPPPCLAQMAPLGPSGPLQQSALLACGMHLLVAPDYTSRRVGCNIASLPAQQLSPAMVQGAPAALQAVAQLYRGQPGLDAALAELLGARGTRCRLSALGAVYRISALAPGLFVRSSQRLLPQLFDPHPDALNMGLPQVAAATMARLAADGGLRAQLQQQRAPKQLVQLLVNLACEGADFGSGSGADWAAREGLEALVQLVQPLPAVLEPQSTHPTATAGPRELGTPAAPSVQQLVGELMSRRAIGRHAVLELLRQLQPMAGQLPS